ncbi:adenylate/guanylate cyclase domain-containing protein [Spirulina major CS-329]|uniref:CHASE2 domain-containing protein n=1 Tax=Spirulina TaxID=1154 RepID=UPI00232B7205|nr:MULTISPECIES: adenylate/guanylate cyclase domain-containing protein [Spirulina]MDB9495551.1 adenylate/guanylate cyclase domain-containing protein [Spirulina subsalsa CS-330]MDB9504318.1 adenylate/guanylate cyclase domain-containing protein [Spirulina major CS-329]
MWNQLKQTLWHWRGVVVAAPSASLLVILVRWAGLLQGWELAVYDQFLRLRPTEPPDARIAIVGMTEDDYRNLGKVVIPDGYYAEVIRELRQQNPRVIGLDDYRDQPIDPGSEDLIAIFETTPNLIGIQKVAGDSELETVDPPPALQERGQVSANDVILDSDGVVRRALVNVQTPEGEIIPTLSLFLAGRYLEAEGKLIDIAPNTDNWWQIGETVLKPFQRYDGGYIRTDDGGYQILLNYQGGAQTIERVSFSTVLEGNLPDGWATDRIILVGAVGATARDQFMTPYGNHLLASPELMPGVEVHAQMTSQLLSAVLNDRALIRTWPEPLEILWIILWTSTGAIAAWSLRHVEKNRIGILKVASIQGGAAVLLIGSSYGALMQSWWIPVVPPLLGFMAATVGITAYVARTAGDIRRTFGRYLTAEVVSTLLENPEGLKMGGERRKITILTSDLRGFTALSERLPPEEVVKILNFYLSYMADIITQYQGTIDEFMGDGILVLFGAPTEREDDARRAIACALAMQLAMAEINVQIEAWGLPKLEMGIGINTGEVVVGNIGSEKRTKYGVVGSQVNLTYRIESYTTGGQVLTSEPTLKEAGADIQIDGTMEVMPKGVKNPITIYTIGGIGAPYNLYLPKVQEQYYPLAPPFTLFFTALDGKHISTEQTPGQVVQLSEKGAEVRLDGDAIATKPEPLTNIKLAIPDLPDDPAGSDDIYAKVVDEPSEANTFFILFTSRPPAVLKVMEQLYQTAQG